MAIRCLLKLVPVAVLAAAVDHGLSARRTEAELRYLGLAEAQAWMRAAEPSPAHLEVAEHLGELLLPVPPEFQSAAARKEQQFLAFAGRRQAPLEELQEVEKEQIPAMPDSDATPDYSRQEHKALVADFWELVFLLGAALCFAGIYYDGRREASRELLRDVRTEDPDSFRQWRHSWYSCYSAPCGTNAVACLCPCVRWAETLSFVKPFPSFWLLFFLFGSVWALSRLGWFSLWGYLLMVLVCVYYRQNLRRQYDMERGGGTYVSDCCVYSLCGCCAIVQEARHVDESHLAHHDAVGGPLMEKPRQQPLAPTALSPQPAQSHALRAPRWEPPQPHAALHAPHYSPPPEEPSKPPSTAHLSQRYDLPGSTTMPPPSTTNLTPRYDLPGSTTMQPPSTANLSPKYDLPDAGPTQPPPASSPSPGPPGTQPGSTLTQLRSPRPPSAPAVEAQEYEVTVPVGVYGGQLIRLAVAAGEVEVTVPAGMVPGQIFRIRV